MMRVNDLLASVGGLVLRRGNAVFKPHGLTVRTFAIMSRLNESELTNSELCALDMDSPSAVAQRVKLLEAKGLIARRKAKGDGRVTHLRLTKAGRSLYEAILPDYARALEPLYSGLEPGGLHAAETMLTTLKARLAGQGDDHAT